MPHHHGKFVWFELYTPDRAKSRAFWSEVLGWQSIEGPMPGGQAYPMLGPEGMPVMGLVDLAQLPDGTPPHFFHYVSVSDVDAVAKACVEHGGALRNAPEDFPTVGRIAVVSDPEGAPFGLFHGEQDDPEDAPSVQGTLHWIELWAQDPKRARTFYEKALGYATEAHPMPGHNGEYVILKHPEVPRAGLMKSPMADTPPHWVGFLHVDDLDATLDRVQRMGGKRLNEPESVEGIGRFCMVQDDQGASIGLITPSSPG